MSKKPDSYAELNKPREPQKTKETVTQTDWDAYNDEKPDGNMKEVTKVEEKVQLEVNTDPAEQEKPAQYDEDIVEKSRNAPSYTCSLNRLGEGSMGV